ncbi:hypothetical protein ABZS29_17590 [Kribbella sp. NPDC005582]|uniref:hypothetical protein n=1 Tax=Kribbella sp. NPDC005582 TaxID=3156893 RepID=UPI0033B7CA23
MSAAACLLVGGISSTTLDFLYSQAYDVWELLLAASQQVALTLRLHNVALYLPSRPSATLESSTVSRIGDDYLLPVPAGGVREYSTSLARQQRRVIQSDLRRLSACGLRYGPLSFEDLLGERSIRLISAVKAGRGAPEDPRLLRMRLRHLVTNIEEPAAFGIWDSADCLNGVVLMGSGNGRLEPLEFGVPDDADHRRLLYAIALVYAPMQVAAERGIGMLRLGPTSPTPKLLRGAQPIAQWAAVSLIRESEVA